jgi:hypothetical protein
VKNCNFADFLDIFLKIKSSATDQGPLPAKSGPPQHRRLLVRLEEQTQLKKKNSVPRKKVLDRVARSFVFIPKFPIWVNLGASWYRRC